MRLLNSNQRGDVEVFCKIISRAVEKKDVSLILELAKLFYHY